MIASVRAQLLLVEVLDRLARLPHPGEHGEHLLHRSDVLELLHLAEEVGEGEVLALGDLRGDPLGLLLVEGLLGLLDQGQDVAHVEDPGGHPIGVEDLEVRHLLPGRGEEDRQAGHVPHGQGRAAAGIAVELGQDDAGDVDALLERVRGGDGVLADHGVDDEEDLVGIDGVADLGRLLHHLGVDAEAPRGVDDDDRVELGLRLLEGGLRDLDGIALGLLVLARDAGLGGEDRDPRPLSDHRQLGDGVGALKVRGDEHGRLARGLEVARELARERRLARALEPREHDDGRARLRPSERARRSAEDLDELLVDDLDDLLRRVQRGRDLGAEGALADRSGEGLDRGKGDVGVEEGAADLANRSRRRRPRSAAPCRAGCGRSPRGDPRARRTRGVPPSWARSASAVDQLPGELSGSPLSAAASSVVDRRCAVLVSASQSFSLHGFHALGPAAAASASVRARRVLSRSRRYPSGSRSARAVAAVLGVVAGRELREQEVVPHQRLEVGGERGGKAHPFGDGGHQRRAGDRVILGPRPLAEVVEQARQEEERGFVDVTLELARADDGLDGVPIDGEAVDGRALRPVAHALPLREPAHDDSREVERLPHGDEVRAAREAGP